MRSRIMVAGVSSEVTPVAGRQNLARYVADSIAQQIVRGAWQPGDVIPPEKNLAELFGVGRSTVREGVQSLVIMGVLEVRRGEGTFIKDPSASMLAGAFLWGLFLGPRTVDDFVAFRTCIEVECAGAAAEYRSSEQLRQMYRYLKCMDEERGNHTQVMECDNSLHVVIAEAAGNAVFTKVVETLQSVVRLWFPVSGNSACEPNATRLEHAAVIDAIRDQDPELARLMMRRHLVNAGNRLSNLFNDRGLEQRLVK